MFSFLKTYRIKIQLHDHVNDSQPELNECVSMYLRKRPTALLMHAYTSEGRALECQQIWWGQAYVGLRNLGGCPLVPSISTGHVFQCGAKAHGFCV